MKKILFILILTIPFIGFGQSWEQTYGGIDADLGSSVQQTSDSGYIITGWTNSFGIGQQDVWLIKTDGNGNEQWTKTFGGTYTDEGFSIQQTNDGGYIITGSKVTVLNGYSDLYLIKTDGNGNEQWTKTFGGSRSDGGYSVQQTDDGGYVITGYYSDLKQIYVYLIRTDENGNEQWSKTFGNQQVESSGHTVQQSSDGGFIIVGRTYSIINESFDIYLIKTDGSGNEQWTKSLGGINHVEGFSLDITSNDEYIICGNKRNSVIGDSDIYLMKTDGNGDSLWTKTFGGNQFELSYSVKETTDNGYIILGETESFGSGKTDFYLIKTDENGNYEWSQTYGGVEDDYGSSLDITSDGGFILCGVTESFGINIQEDIWLIKTDDQGNITSTFEIPLPNPNRKLEKTINLNGQEIIPQTNQPIVEIFDDGSTQKKIIIE